MTLNGRKKQFADGSPLVSFERGVESSRLGRLELLKTNTTDEFRKDLNKVPEELHCFLDETVKVIFEVDPSTLLLGSNSVVNPQTLGRILSMFGPTFQFLFDVFENFGHSVNFNLLVSVFREEDAAVARAPSVRPFGSRVRALFSFT